MARYPHRPSGQTHLTRRSIHRILVGSGRLDDFKCNPQQFIEITTEIINRAKRMALVDGINTNVSEPKTITPSHYSRPKSFLVT